MAEWSHEPDIATVRSYTTINFSISAEVEEIDPTTQETTLVPVTDLEYTEAGNEDEILPENITITENGSSVNISGEIAAEAEFILLEYTNIEGRVTVVEEVDKIPLGSPVCTMQPETDEYKYFRWTVFSSSENISRLFTLTVRVTWEEAKKTIKEKVGEITWETQ